MEGIVRHKLEQVPITAAREQFELCVVYDARDLLGCFVVLVAKHDHNGWRTSI